MRQNEGKAYIGSMNRAQQAFFEKNNKLTTNIKELELGTKSEMDDYVYKIVLQSNPQSVMNIGRDKRRGMKSYVGLVYVVKVEGEDITIAELCESKKYLTQLPKMPKLAEDASKSEDIKCPSGFESLYPGRKKR